MPKHYVLIIHFSRTWILLLNFIVGSFALFKIQKYRNRIKTDSLANRICISIRFVITHWENFMYLLPFSSSSYFFYFVILFSSFSFTYFVLFVQLLFDLAYTFSLEVYFHLDSLQYLAIALNLNAMSFHYAMHRIFELCQWYSEFSFTSCICQNKLNLNNYSWKNYSFFFLFTQSDGKKQQRKYFENHPEVNFC